MSGRRRYERFQPAQPWEGHFRVLQDVVVQLEGAGQLVALGHAPGVVGEIVRLDLSGGGRTVSLDVRIGESRPVMVDGCVRHRVSLEPVTSIADNEPVAVGWTGI
jgi:hypothetical protein